MLRVKREREESSRVYNNGAGGAETDNGDGTPTPSNMEMKCPDRRLLRSRYRELKSQVNDHKGQLAQADFVDFRALVDRAEKLHKHVNKPREQITDAELLGDITSELLVVAKGAQAKCGMSAAEFVGAIIHSYSLPGTVDGTPGQSLHWDALGLEACAIVRHAPGMSTMVGPMDVEVKVRRAVYTRRERPTDRTRPQQVVEAEADRPNTETDANMTTMFKVLIDLNEVQLDCLVLNRVSFAQTIENLFALSFLVKDGRVEFKIAEDGTQFVVPRNAPAHADRAEGSVLNTQFVFRLDFHCWRLMQDSVPEGEEVMPHRDSTKSSPASLPKTVRTPIRKNSRNRARETPTVSPPADSPEDASGERSSRFKRRLALPSD